MVYWAELAQHKKHQRQVGQSRSDQLASAARAYELELERNELRWPWHKAHSLQTPTSVRLKKTSVRLSKKWKPHDCQTLFWLAVAWAVAWAVA